MKFIFRSMFVLMSLTSYSQTFSETWNGNSGDIPDNGPETCFDITVSGVGNLDGTTTAVTEICFDIDHTFDGDLDIFLHAPDGTIVELSTDNGGTGDNYTNTCFDMSAGTNVTSGSAPFTGSFIPEGNLNDFSTGNSANGTWQICITDDASGDIGEINSASITFGTPSGGGGGSITMSNGSSNTCSGTFYDSGGAGGDYSSGESYVYTICPDAAGNYSEIDFTSFNTESGYDELTIYDGANTSAPVLGTYTGTTGPGIVTSSDASGCLTFEFTSDGSTVDPGWVANIGCSTTPGSGPTPVCSDLVINTTMFSQSGLTTCGSGDDFSSSDACGSSYMGGEDYVIEYTPNTSECVEIALTNTDSWTGVFITDECPNSGTANCVGEATSSGGNPTLSGVNLTAGQTYYITISTFPSPDCTPFDIDVTACPPPPSNDECSGATVVSVNTDGTCTVTEPGTVQNATNSSQTNDCSGTANNDVWFSFVATGTTQEVELLNVTGSTTDLYHSVYEGNCGSIGTAIVCSDPDVSSLSGLTVGNTYYVRVFSYGSGAADTDFDICIKEIVPTAQDCAGAQTVCTDDTFTGNSSGDGNIDDLDLSNEGCLSGENESSWYFFSPQTAGQIELTINTSVDYDFAIWGPLGSASCPPSNSPIRCSFSADNGPTGLSSGSGDQTEGSTGDAFVDPLNVNAGEVYIMVIDNYTADGTSFDLDWTLSGGASLDCTVLDVDYTSFNGKKLNDYVKLNWTTMTESNSDHFIVEKAGRDSDFEIIGTIKSNGNTNEESNYDLIDYNPHPGVNYYKLKEVTTDGEVTAYKTISVNFDDLGQVSVYPNPTKENITVSASDFRGKNVQFSIIDIYGKTVDVVKISQWSGKYNYNSTNLKSGIYTFTILDAQGNRESIRFIKQ